MLMDIVVDIDSSLRNEKVYPNPNEYVLFLSRPIYNIESLKFISGNIPNSQLTFHNENDTVYVDNVAFNLPHVNVTDGFELANILANTITSTNVDSVIYQSNTNSLIVSNTGANNFTIQFPRNGEIFGFHNHELTDSNIINGQNINLDGPMSIVVQMSSYDDVYSKDVYANKEDNKVIYTGRILTYPGIIRYSSIDDPLEHRFDKKVQSSIYKIKIKFSYFSGSELVPYDFRNRNHTIKLSFKGYIDKMEANKVIPEENDKLPPPVDMPMFEPPKRKIERKNIFIIIAVVLLLSLTGLLFLKR